jgi:protein-S-isoprenylcysteine O-methyltransferase Ste14
VLGAALVLLGDVLFVWAMAVNKFFSRTVRIQTEREHVVVMTGPYRYVRHPGYVGWTILWLGLTLILGSLWAFIPALLAVALIVVRTALEDKTLKKELESYEVYAEWVRYRLLPRVW